MKAKGTWTHHVILERESDFDEDVRRWLREAYEQGRRPRQRKRKGAA